MDRQNYVADIVVENVILIELKCGDQLVNQHLAPHQLAESRKSSSRATGQFPKAKLEWKQVFRNQ